MNELASHCFLQREKHFYRVPKRTRMSLAERKAVSRCARQTAAQSDASVLLFWLKLREARSNECGLPVDDYLFFKEQESRAQKMQIFVFASLERLTHSDMWLWDKDCGEK